MTEPKTPKVETTGGRPSRAAAKPKQQAIPAGAKKPQDHQPAKADVAPKDFIITWNTAPGEPNEDGSPGERVPAVYIIPASHFDDIDFMDAMIEMQTAETDADRSMHAYLGIKSLLGPEQFKQYKINERDPETGRTTFSGTIPFFNHVVEEANQGN